MSDHDLTDWQLMRLRDCAGSNKIGMLDRGFPAVMMQLGALGLVECKPDGGGCKVTATGKTLLAANDNRERLKQLGGCV